MRRPRLELPGIPLHLTHRGVNRAAVFLDDEDRSAYLQDLRECALREQVDVHAWVLMGNHVHLLLSAEASGAISRMMQAMGRRYVRAFNAKYRRTGTLWEGRFKSCLVDSDTYVLRCLRYIELNPVRAAMVEHPEAYRWSSVHQHLGRERDPLWRPHRCFLDLAGNAADRAARYRELLCQPLDPTQLLAIRSHIQQERALGDACFQAMVERTLQRPAAIRPVGRPPRGESTKETNQPLRSETAVSSGNVL